MMILNRYFILLFLCQLYVANVYSQEQTKEDAEHHRFADGPYVLHLPGGGARIISVDTTGVKKDITIDKLSSDFALSVTSHRGKHRFQVTLHKLSRPAWKYDKPEKVFVLSDPHGDLDCFVSVLRGNNVINDHYEWSYGKNHLVIIGDVFDRGKDVLPIFWLIYKLEKEARDAGGHVSFLLGNHEPMILAGDLRYMEKMYHRLAEELGIRYEELFSEHTELGRWLGLRNTIEVIGDDLYVHAGLGEEFLNRNLSIPEVNEEMSRALFMTKTERNERSELTQFLYGSQGPIWYRGMVRNDEKYHPLHIDVLDKILRRYHVGRIIVGHTIFPDVRTFYYGKVVAVNVNNRKNFEAVLGRGILIENDKTFVIGDKTIMNQLFVKSNFTYY